LERIWRRRETEMAELRGFFEVMGLTAAGMVV
jgi:hypothetical protein